MNEATRESMAYCKVNTNICNAYVVELTVWGGTQCP